MYLFYCSNYKISDYYNHFDIERILLLEGLYKTRDSDRLIGQKSLKTAQSWQITETYTYSSYFYLLMLCYTFWINFIFVQFVRFDKIKLASKK